MDLTSWLHIVLCLYVAVNDTTKLKLLSANKKCLKIKTIWLHRGKPKGLCRKLKCYEVYMWLVTYSKYLLMILYCYIFNKLVT